MRQFLTVVLPLILPFLLYGIYLALAQRKARLAGAERLPAWQDAPWSIIVIAGVLLMGAVLVAVRMTSGVEPGVTIEPPRFTGGKVEPSRVAE